MLTPLAGLEDFDPCLSAPSGRGRGRVRARARRAAPARVKVEGEEGDTVLQQIESTWVCLSTFETHTSNSNSTYW